MIGFSKKTAHVVEIQPAGLRVAVPPGETILQAALDQGIDFPHNCRVGSCTTCKSRLVKGKVKELSDSAYVLSDADIDSGMILACQSVPSTDAVIEKDVS